MTWVDLWLVNSPMTRVHHPSTSMIWLMAWFVGKCSSIRLLSFLYLIALFALFVTENDALRTISTSLFTAVGWVESTAKLIIYNAGLREYFKFPLGRSFKLLKFLSDEEFSGVDLDLIHLCHRVISTNL